MNTWQILTANSTAGAGATAWAHLNSQQGGSGGTTVAPLASLVAQVSNASITAHSADGSLTLTPTGVQISLLPTSPTLSMDIKHGSINHPG